MDILPQTGAEILSAYLAGKRRIDFAKRVGCSAGHLSLILSGARLPSRKLSRRIYNEAAVPMDSWDESAGGRQ